MRTYEEMMEEERYYDDLARYCVRNDGEEVEFDEVLGDPLGWGGEDAA